MAWIRSQEIFFVALAVIVAAGASSADSDQGADLYEQCAQCHGVNGEGSQFFLAPSIAGMAPWYVESQLRNFRTGARGLHPDDVGGLRMYPIAQSLKSTSSHW